MKPAESSHSIEEVLEAYAMEKIHDKHTLSLYISSYPHFAAELVDLTQEMSFDHPVDQSVLVEADAGFVENAWSRFAAVPYGADILTKLSVEEQRHLAQALNVPRQVITALRERRVRPETIARPFLVQVAEHLNHTLEDIIALLVSPSPRGLARSYKSYEKPSPEKQISFEELLVEAGVPEQRRAELLQEG